MSAQQTLVEQINELYRREMNKSLEYQIRLLKITLVAERELRRIEVDGGMTRFPEEIIKLAEGKV